MSREQELERLLALSSRLFGATVDADVLVHACRELRALTGATRTIACYAAAPESWERGLHLEIGADASTSALPPAARSAAFAVHRRVASARAPLALDPGRGHDGIFRGLGVPTDGSARLRAVPLLYRTGRLVGELLFVVPAGDGASGVDAEIARIAILALQNVQRLVNAKKAQERLLLLAETTNEALWDWEIETGELWWGGGIQVLVGSSGEMIEHKIGWKRERIHGADAERVRSSLEAALDSPTTSSWSDTYRFRRAGGDWAIVEDHAYFLRDVGGRAYRVVGSMRDVTELHASGEALRRNEERLRAALDASDIGTYVWDVATGEVHADERAKRLFDLGPGEGLLLDDHASRIHPGDRDAWSEAIRRTAVEGSLLHLEYRVVRPDGGVRWLLDRGRAVRGADGAVAYVPGARMDVTARKALEAERERESLRAIDANRAKDEFLAMLGHELRNPLSPMTTALHLLRTRGVASREIDVLERQVRHLTRLVDDLLDVSRITRGKVEIRKSPVDLADVVARAVEMASPLLEQRRHRLHLHAPRGTIVEGDAARLAQVVSNLVTNAAKYSDPGSDITLSAGRRGGRAELRVVDRGVGIAPAMLDRVFDMFVQQPQTIERSHGGLGLGLAIVKSLVELHGGTVRASSELDVGSEFVIDLPISASELAEEEGSGMRTVPTGATRVMVVDDNVDAAELLRDVLVSLGHAVCVAHDGPTALRLAEEFRPEVALLDIGLPVMDGYELGAQLRALRGVGPGIRLVAITGYGQREDHLRSEAAGFARHLVKPVDLAQLASVLEASPARDDRTDAG